MDDELVHYFHEVARKTLQNTTADVAQLSRESRIK